MRTFLHSDRFIVFIFSSSTPKPNLGTFSSFDFFPEFSSSCRIQNHSSTCRCDLTQQEEFHLCIKISINVPFINLFSSIHASHKLFEVFNKLILGCPPHLLTQHSSLIGRRFISRYSSQLFWSYRTRNSDPLFRIWQTRDPISKTACNAITFASPSVV
jgi:hypothetical protein